MAREEPLTVRRPPRRCRHAPSLPCQRCHVCPSTHDVTVHFVGVRRDTYSMCEACARWAVEVGATGNEDAEEHVVYGSEHVYS